MARKARSTNITIGFDGVKLKKKRTELGFSQEYIAKEAKITKAYISKIETGEQRRVSLEVGEAIAKALNIAIEEFKVSDFNISDTFQFLTSENTIEAFADQLTHQLNAAIQSTKQIAELSKNTNGNDGITSLQKIASLENYKDIEINEFIKLTGTEHFLEEDKEARDSSLEFLQLVKQFIPGVDFETLVASIFFGVLNVTNRTPAQLVSVKNQLRLARLNIKNNLKTDLPYLLSEEAWNITQIVEKSKAPTPPDEPKEIYEDEELCSDILVYDPRSIALVLINVLRGLYKNLKSDQGNQRFIAYQALRVYGPLSGQLGWQELRRQIYDYGFQLYAPQSYSNWNTKVQELSKKTSGAVKKAFVRLQAVLQDEEIDNPYIKETKRSIYSIMRDPEESDSPTRLLIVTENPEGVLRALRKLHEIWPSPYLINDYINHPKPSGYQSIHTTIVVDDFRIRVHIRTKEMDMVAQQGILSQIINSYVEKLEHLRMDYLPRLLNYTDIFNKPENSNSNRPIYVSTKDGLLRGLPENTTVLKFIELVYPNEVENAIASRVNGKEEPLHYNLQNMDQVEYILGSNLNKYIPATWIDYKNSLLSNSQVRIIAKDRRKLLHDICEKIETTKGYLIGASVNTELTGRLVSIGLNMKDILPWQRVQLKSNLEEIKEILSVHFGPPIFFNTNLQSVMPNFQLQLVALDNPMLLHELRLKAVEAKLNIIAAKVTRKTNEINSPQVEVILSFSTNTNYRLRDFCINLLNDKIVESVNINFPPFIKVFTNDREKLLLEICKVLAEHKMNITGLRAQIIENGDSIPQAIITLSLQNLTLQTNNLKNDLLSVVGDNLFSKILINPSPKNLLEALQMIETFDLSDPT